MQMCRSKHALLRTELSKHPHTSWSFSALLVGRAPAYLVPRRVATKQWLQMAVDCNGHRLLNPGIHHPFQQRTGKEDKGVLLQGLRRPKMADQSEAKQWANATRNGPPHGAFMWCGWISKGAGLKSKSAAAACHLGRDFQTSIQGRKTNSCSPLGTKPWCMRHTH